MCHSTCTVAMAATITVRMQSARLQKFMAYTPLCNTTTITIMRTLTARLQSLVSRVFRVKNHLYNTALPFNHAVGGQAQGGGARTGSSSSSSFSSSTSPRLTGQSMPSSAAAAAGTSPESFIAGANFNLGAGGSGGSEGAGTGWSGFAPASTYEMTLSEHGDTMLVLTATSRNTGRHVIIETITCVSDMVVSAHFSGVWECVNHMHCVSPIRVHTAVRYMSIYRDMSSSIIWCSTICQTEHILKIFARSCVCLSRPCSACARCSASTSLGASWSASA